MTTPTNRHTELAHRTSDGIDVHLYWIEPTRRAAVSVLDARRDESFEFEVDGRQALDAFNHPYAYAGRSDAAHFGAEIDAAGDSRHTTIDTWRTHRARTDR
jgi:hypothetical protein